MKHILTQQIPQSTVKNQPQSFYSNHGKSIPGYKGYKPGYNVNSQLYGKPSSLLINRVTSQILDTSPKSLKGIPGYQGYQHGYKSNSGKFGKPIQLLQESKQESVDVCSLYKGYMKPHRNFTYVGRNVILPIPGYAGRKKVQFIDRSPINKTYDTPRRNNGKQMQGYQGYVQHERKDQSQKITGFYNKKYAEQAYLQI